MKIMIACVTSLLLVLSTGVSARGYGHGYGYGNHGYGHSYGHGYRHHGYGHGYRGFRQYGYGGYGHHGGHASYLLGGLLLGTLLDPPQYSPPPHVVYAPPATTTVAPVRQAQAPISRRLLRDINGNCFERKIDAAGSELRIQLPAGDCAW